MIRHIRKDGARDVVVESIIDEDVEEIGFRLENAVDSYLYRNPDFPRPVEIRIETPPGFASGWVKLDVRTKDSCGIDRGIAKLISPSLISQYDYESRVYTTVVKDWLDEMKRHMELNLYGQSKTVSDLMAGLANPIWTAYNSIFGRTCWGKVQSSHPADAVKVVYTSGPVTTLIFKNGEKFQVRKSDNDLLNKEKGLAMVVCKALLDKEAYEVLCKYAGKNAVTTLAKFLMSPPEYAKLKAEKWKVFDD